jgi:hypothetical protein
MTRATTTSRPCPRHAAGFTLAELLLTVFVIGTAFVAGTWSMSATARTKAAYAEGSGPAAYLARELLALADGLPRAPSGATGATTGAAVVALCSLEGASFSPPILADGSAADGFDGWRQDVDLSIYALDDLTTPTGEDPADGLAPEAARLYRLDVSILHDDELVDAYSWWIHP